MTHHISSIRTVPIYQPAYRPGHVVTDKQDVLTQTVTAIDAEIDAAGCEIRDVIRCAGMGKQAKWERLQYLRRLKAELVRRRDYALIVRGEYAARYVG
jgi:hypothetical protein